MDSNDGGCVQSWMTGWLAGELNAQELLLLLTAKILGNSGIFQFAFKVHILTYLFITIRKSLQMVVFEYKQSYETSTAYLCMLLCCIYNPF